MPSEKEMAFDFPYVLIKEEHIITWEYLEELTDETIMYDGRKEEKMSDKYLITKEFMDDLKKWRDEHNIKLDLTEPFSHVTGMDFYQLPDQVVKWWAGETGNPWEINNRLMAIIRWLNGEEVFETQKTYKYFVARTSAPFTYLSMKKWYHSEFPKYDSDFSKKKIFDTREEAEKWLIPGYEVEEIDENEL